MHGLHEEPIKPCMEVFLKTEALSLDVRCVYASPGVRHTTGRKFHDGSTLEMIIFFRQSLRIIWVM